MSIVRKTYDFLYEYFTIPLPPMKLEANPYWDMIPITPEHAKKKVEPVEDNDEYCITPIHETEVVKGQTITRAFGDLLAEEMG